MDGVARAVAAALSAKTLDAIRREAGGAAGAAGPVLAAVTGAAGRVRALGVAPSARVRRG